MSGRKNEKRARRPVMGSHQKCWIWGRNVVLETFRARRWPILELRLADRLDREARAIAERLAEQAGTPVIVESFQRLTRRCGSGDHQGYIAKMPPYPYESPEEVLQRAPRCPIYLILDRLQDPHNFGAILRSAVAFGADGVFVPRKGQVKVTSAVARSSAGAVNHIVIGEVECLPAWIGRLRQEGVRVVATAPDASTPVFHWDWTRPAAVVLGSEADGVSAEVLAVCDERVVIPQSSELNSLNVAACASICLYEICRQRWLKSPRRSATSTPTPDGSACCPPP